MTAEVAPVEQDARLRRVEDELRALRSALLAAERDRADGIARAHPDHRRSATNLVHYVELRRHDIRELQQELGLLGLSSLGQCESHVLGSIEAVLTVVSHLNGSPVLEPRAGGSMTGGPATLADNADRLLGPAPAHRGARIMVTLPSQAADEPLLVGAMVDAGMDVARINCAHDDRDRWVQMIEHLRSRPRPDGSPCRIAMDLAGPKLRTGPLRPGAGVVKVKPRRDELGRVTAPGRVWLLADPTEGSVPDERRDAATVPVADPTWALRRRPGDAIHLRDSRGSKRVLQVLETTPEGCLVTTHKTAYLATGTELRCDGDTTTVGELPMTDRAHRVEVGDTVILTRSLEPADPTPAGSVHRIGCSLPEAFQQVRPGERVWLDDGKLGGVVQRVSADEIRLTVTDVEAGGAKLKAEKGINLPDTDLDLEALTAKDREDLDVVATAADLVNVSFVRRPTDVAAVQDELRQRGADDVGVVLKIENATAFEHLPELLLTALASHRVGVMIARGDLAVEVGFDRLAEVQEEILWLCEAAHVPVVWATEVLDTLAKTGRTTRAEVTDAAMAERAECVMLNKGPRITEAIGALDSILTRMRSHQNKKQSLLRRLRSWDLGGPSAG